MSVDGGKREVVGSLWDLVHLIIVHLLVILLHLLGSPLILQIVGILILLRMFLFSFFSSFMGICAFISQFALSLVFNYFTLGVEFAKYGFVVDGLSFLDWTIVLSRHYLLMILGYFIEIGM